MLRTQFLPRATALLAAGVTATVLGAAPARAADVAPLAAPSVRIGVPAGPEVVPLVPAPESVELRARRTARAELRKHSKRIARLNRIMALASRETDTDLYHLAVNLVKLELRRHGRALRRLSV